MGRLPVIVGLENLDEDALVKIIRLPKNSLEKQYKRLFELDGVELEFTDEALSAIAAQAIKRNTGARGLRSIIEENMTQLMFEIPSRPDVEKVIITADTINNKALPIVELKKPELSASTN